MDTIKPRVRAYAKLGKPVPDNLRVLDFKTPPVPFLVNILKDALKRAEDGQLTSLILAAGCTDGQSFSGWYMGRNATGAVAEVELIKHEVMGCLTRSSD